MDSIGCHIELHEEAEDPRKVGGGWDTPEWKIVQRRSSPETVKKEPVPAIPGTFLLIS